MTITGKSTRGRLSALVGGADPPRPLNLVYLLLVAVLPLLALAVVALQPFWQATIDPGSSPSSG
mgnify:CR=1 FL=1